MRISGEIMHIFVELMHIFGKLVLMHIFAWKLISAKFPIVFFSLMCLLIIVHANKEVVLSCLFETHYPFFSSWHHSQFYWIISGNKQRSNRKFKIEPKNKNEITLAKCFLKEQFLIREHPISNQKRSYHHQNQKFNRLVANELTTQSLGGGVIRWVLIVSWITG